MELENISSKSLPINEQETHISFMRDESFARIYTSDSTQITRLDKLCKNNPTIYSVLEDTGYGKSYICNDKTLISFRAKKRVISDEQKAAAGERMRKYRKKRGGNMHTFNSNQ